MIINFWQVKTKKYRCYTYLNSLKNIQVYDYSNQHNVVINLFCLNPEEI